MPETNIEIRVGVTDGFGYVGMMPFETEVAERALAAIVRVGGHIATLDIINRGGPNEHAEIGFPSPRARDDVRKMGELAACVVNGEARVFSDKDVAWIRPGDSLFE
jgi:hypothetical protein